MNLFSNLFSLHHGEEKKEIVRESVVSNISFRGANLWILACAILIASIGLNVNSTAVIIGAMLISPLMGPIVGSGFALATYDFIILKRSIKNLFIATIVGLIVSSLYFYLSPFKEIQSEILSRTSPTIYDVLIAFFGGIVGAVSITRVEKGNPIPGVAIATALMPPLCTAGFGIATLNIKFIAGALYLYSINCFFICISTFIVLKYLKYNAIKTENEKLDRIVRLVITIGMILMIIPSTYLAYTLIKEKEFAQNVNKFIDDNIINKGNTIIYKNINNKSKPRKIELALLSNKIDSIEIQQLNKKLDAYNLTNTNLIIKQNSSDLKKEILNELNKNTLQVSEKDIQIQQLIQEINENQFGNNDLEKEIKILFPEIKKVTFGVVKDYSIPDSIIKNNIIIYYTDKIFNDQKLQQWLAIKLNNDNIQVIKSN